MVINMLNFADAAILASGFNAGVTPSNTDDTFGHRRANFGATTVTSYGNRARYISVNSRHGTAKRPIGSNAASGQHHQ